MKLCAFVLAAVIACSPTFALEAEPPKVVCPALTNPVPDSVLFSSYRVSVFESALFDEDGRQVTEAQRAGSGSGVAISARLLLTAMHVADGSPGIKYEIDVYDKDGAYARSIKCKFVKCGTFPASDIALLEAQEDLPYWIDATALGEIAVGEPLYNTGAKLGLSPYNVSWGTLASKGFDFPDTFGLWQASLQAAPGCSGGGVYNKHHQLVGILTQGVQGYGLSWFVPAPTIAQFLGNKAASRVAKCDHCADCDCSKCACKGKCKGAECKCECVKREPSKWEPME